MSARQTCVVLQPGYLPWLGFFEQMWHADVFVYLDDVQFDKHGWRNRNRIKGPAGPQWLTVPVRVSGLQQPVIRDILIDPTQPRWPTKHLQALRTNYSACPFFTWLFPELEAVLLRPWTGVADLDIATTEVLCRKLGVERPLHRSSALAVPPGRCERLVAFCQILNCDRYYSGAAAKDYMDEGVFARAGISVEFQNYQYPEYPQRYGAFVSHLSVVDLLFNCGPRSLDVLTGAAARPTGISA
jgi:hypothetical protein